MLDIRSQKLADFVTWTAAHIKGDEKGDAQIFLDRLFQAFGQKGAKEAGGTYEDRVKNEAGGTSFADYVWKPIVLGRERFLMDLLHRCHALSNSPDPSNIAA